MQTLFFDPKFKITLSRKPNLNITSMDAFVHKHMGAMKELEKLKSYIECDGDTCKAVPVLPTAFYNEWVDTMKSNIPQELHQLKQRRINVLGNLLFSDKGRFLVESSNYDDKDLYFVKDDHVVLDAGKLDMKRYDDQLRNGFFVIRKYLQTHEEMKMVIDMRNLTFSQVCEYYFKGLERHHLCSFLILETLEKMASEAEILVKGLPMQIFANFLKDRVDLRTVRSVKVTCE